jgi:hypothetical protein
MTQQVVLDPQFFFLEAGDEIVVGMGAVFFVVEERFERCVLVDQCFRVGLVHRYHSLREWMRQSSSKSCFSLFVSLRMFGPSSLSRGPAL